MILHTFLMATENVQNVGLGPSTSHGGCPDRVVHQLERDSQKPDSHDQNFENSCESSSQVVCHF